MAIFGRRTARQRLRKPARESLAIPTFSPAADCKPWVIGGLWPAELSTPTSQTASVADHLRSDLQRFAARANEDLIGLRRKPMADSVRYTLEARVIEEARARAVHRVDSTLRYLDVAVMPGTGLLRLCRRWKLWCPRMALIATAVSSDALQL